MAQVELKSYAFRRAREKAWQELDELVSRCRSDGCDRLETDDLLKLPHLYRGAASSLSVARSISLDRNVTVYLESLVRRAYFVLYGARLRSLRELVRYLLGQLPVAIARSRRALSTSVAVFLLAALFGGVVTLREPGYFFALAPAGAVDTLGSVVGSSSVEASLPLERHLWSRHTSGDFLRRLAEFPFDETAITPFMVAAGGVAFGLPTVVLLMYAGAHVGALAAVFISHGLGLEFLFWAIGTGTLQWLGLWLCAAAGFSLAESLVFPPVGGRLLALRTKGWTAGTLVVGGLGMILLGQATLAIVGVVAREPGARLVLCLAISAGWLSFLFRRRP